jgi:ATP-dependent Clp protease ATP-binding subunit ClpA/ATP-dependent Clp protease ATP-binding subunit ClpC
MSTVSFSIPVYQRKFPRAVRLTTLGLGPYTRVRAGANLVKVEEQLVADLRRAAEECPPADLPLFELKRGARLERVRVELSLKDGPKRKKVAGLCPLVLEPRHFGGERVVLVAYHPERPAEWFPLRPYESIAEQAEAYLAQAWSSLEDDELESLWSDQRDSIRMVSFGARVRSLLDELPERNKGLWDDLQIDPVRGKKEKKRTGGLKVLPKIGVDLTAKSAQKASDLGMPRSPYREQLQMLLCGPRKKSTLVVGAPGVGKSTILRRLVADLLAQEDYDSHKNLDRVSHVWRISGKQIIAGMSFVGDWEQRCVDIADDVRGRSILLLVSDIHLFGQIGRARDSERSLADFFRGPVARGQVVMIGECTPEQLRRLEEDAPSFASLFARTHVAPASRRDTMRMMLHRARDLELEQKKTLAHQAFETILDLGGALFPSQELPGKAIDLLERTMGAAKGAVVDSREVLAQLSERTGLPSIVLEADAPLEKKDVVEELSQKVMGQPGAVGEVADLVLRIKSGMCDPRRPFAVYLFTGPTGTGKTELAKALAEYLYGSASRLVRFDMSELGGPDAPSRLIGDTWSPEGLLTRAGLEQPFCVLLLDEIEKAHPSVLNLLLQLFDEGRLTDAAGNTASFTQSVIIMTSNLGARRREPVGFGEQPGGLMLDVARAVREFFPPELFNRIDAVVPFQPLSREVAVDVAQKELSKLLGRAGLTERNIFVQATRGVVERVARDAFATPDGARSLKRFLEDHIGSLLSREIAKSPGAAMQIMHVLEAPDGFHVVHEALEEARPVAVRFALESIWSVSLDDLRARLPAASADLARIEASPALGKLAEQLRSHLSAHNRGETEHGEALYNVEWLRITLAALRERIDQLAIESRDLHHDEIEDRLADPETRSRARASLPGSTRWNLFSAIAEVHAMRRALELVNDPTQHAVLIELIPVGAGPTLLDWLTRAYAWARGTLDEACFLVAGEICDGVQLGQVNQHLAKAPEVVVLKKVGLCVTDFFELETGTHAWHPLARSPELVRVRVLPARHDDSPRALLGRYLAQKADWQRSSAPEKNPTKLLPLVRSIRFDPPKPRKPAQLLELEDYVLGLSESWRVRDVGQALAAIWLLRLSRLEGTP